MKSSSNSILQIMPGQEIIETSPVIILLYMCSNKHYEQYVWLHGCMIIGLVILFKHIEQL